MASHGKKKQRIGDTKKKDKANDSDDEGDDEHLSFGTIVHNAFIVGSDGTRPLVMRLDRHKVVLATEDNMKGQSPHPYTTAHQRK